jgi:hypothetical protein
MSYHKAKRASQPETNFRMNLNRNKMMKLDSRDVNAYTYERRIWLTQLGGQLWGTRDSFLPTRALSFDYSVQTSMDVVWHLRPSSSYNRLYDPTESALRALPFGTWPVPSEFYDYIAAWLGPILEFAFSQQRCEFLETRAVWPDAAGGRGRSQTRLVANALSARLPVRRICLSSRIWGFQETPQVRLNSTTSLNSKPFNLMRPLRGSTNCCVSGI